MQNKIIKKALAIGEAQATYVKKWQSALEDLRYFENKVSKARTPTQKQQAQQHRDQLKAYVETLYRKIK